MRNILFRADSSSTVGTGHIMRDLVLADQFKDTNIIFATQNLSGNINHKIEEKNYTIEILNSNEIEEVIKLISKYSIDMIIIDNYDIDYSYEKKLKERTSVKIFALDDTYEKHYCDILLNHNISADKKRYKGLVPEGCELRCGAEYTLLRDEFLQPFPKKSTNNYTNVLLALGGVDSKELNIPILKILSNYSFIKVDLITTTANKNLNKLQEFVLDKKNIILHINTSEVAKLMHENDLAILTPSVTVNEAYYMKLPFIAVKTEENQDEIYRYLKKNNYLVLDKFDEKIFSKKLAVLLAVLKAELVEFTALSLEEKKMVLAWRNDESIRKRMYNRDEITLQNHLAYIDSLLNKVDRKYFLLKDKSNYFGVVDLTDIVENDSAELGIYVKPGSKGYGSLLMHKVIDHAFNMLELNKLTANVYIDNSAAINLYKKFNFVVVNNTEDDNGKLYCMELKNENR